MNEYVESVLEIVDDNPDKGLKEEESVSNKYFNFNQGKVNLTKLNVEKTHKKSQMITVNKSLVRKYFNRFHFRKKFILKYLFFQSC